MPPLPGTFSQKPEPNSTRLVDCMYACIIMLCYAAGVNIGVPFDGAHVAQLVALRERFEDASGLPESQQEHGIVGYHYADVASQKLWGFVTHPATTLELPALLNDPTILVAMTGRGPGLKSGVTANHSVVFGYHYPGGVAYWDPIRGMLYRHEEMPLPNALSWHAQLPQDIRYVRIDEALAYYQVRAGDTVASIAGILGEWPQRNIGLKVRTR